MSGFDSKLDSVGVTSDSIIIGDADNTPGNEIGEIHDDGTLPGDPGYIQQGNNEAGLKGTCALNTIASNLNELTGSELSENDMVQTALSADAVSAERDNGITAQANEFSIGSDTLYEIVSEQTPEAGNISVDSVTLSQENMDDINAALQATEVRIAAGIDSGVLWGKHDDLQKIDHAIAIQEPAFDEDGNTIGYLINDTGGGKVFAEVDELADAGLFKGEQLVISKDQEDIEVDEIMEPGEEPVDEIAEEPAINMTDNITDQLEDNIETETILDYEDLADEDIGSIAEDTDLSFEDTSEEIVDVSVDDSACDDLSDEISSEEIDTLDYVDMSDGIDAGSYDDATFDAGDVSIDSADAGGFEGGAGFY